MSNYLSKPVYFITFMKNRVGSLQAEKTVKLLAKGNLNF